MKRLLASALVFLSCTSYAHDRAMIARCAVGKKAPTCCVSNNKCRGPRGHKGNRGPRGERGRRGRPGTTATFLDELFINADMMASAPFTSAPDRLFDMTYGQFTPLDAWALSIPDENTTRIGAQFVIPDTLDRTQPVTLTIHILQSITGVPTTGDVQFEMQMDYRATTELLGIVPPATGYAETLLTTPLNISPPILDTNLRYFTTSIQLDPTLMIGKTWGFIVITRVPVLANGFGGLVYLTAFSIQYTKLSS